MYHADVRPRFNVKVSCVKESANVQSGDRFQCFVRGVGCGALPVKVKVIRVWRGLQVPILERFPVPYPVCLVDVHMVHMYGDPDVAGGIGDLVVYVLFYDEIVCFTVPVPDVVYAGCVDRGEIEFHVMVFVIIAPGFDLPAEHFGFVPIVFNFVNGGCFQRFIFFVQFNDGCFLLSGQVAYL